MKCPLCPEGMTNIFLAGDEKSIIILKELAFASIFFDDKKLYHLSDIHHSDLNIQQTKNLHRFDYFLNLQKYHNVVNSLIN